MSAALPSGWTAEPVAPGAPPPDVTVASAPAPVALPKGWQPEAAPAEPGLTGTITDDSDPRFGHPVPNVAEGDHVVGPGEAAWDGVKAGTLGGWDDELNAATGALGNKFGHFLGLNQTNIPLSQVYDQILQHNRAEKEAAYEQNPWAYRAGYVPGMLLGAFALGGGKAAEAAPTLWGRLGRSAAGGAVQGAVVGAGNGEGLGGTVTGTVEGGALGAPLGVAMHPLAAVLNSGVSRVTRIGADPANSGLEAITARAPQDITAMRTAQAEMQAGGVAPRVVDVVDASGRGVMRDAASKMTPGREAVVAHAKAVSTGAQDDVADLANREISSAPVTARQAGDALTGSRDAQMETDMAPIRNDPLPITDDMKSVLGTREGRAALVGAEGLMTDPADRANVRAVLKAANSKPAAPVDPDVNFRAQIPGWDKFGEAAKQAVREQHPDMIPEPAKDPWDGVNMTVDMADKFARAMQGRAANTPGLERVASQFAKTVRQSARDAHPQYDQALTDFADRSKVIDAASGDKGTRYEGTNFLTSPADQYADGVAQASPIAPDEGSLSEADALRARARDDVVNKATGGGGQNAPGVARQLGYGGAQQTKSAALLGPEGAQRLQAGGKALDKRFENTQYINPNAGSKTYSASHDAIVDGFGHAAEAAHFAASPGTASMAHVTRLAGRWLKQGGIKGVDAHRLSLDAISDDPARVNAAIEYLAKRGMDRARAGRFVSTFANALVGRAAGTAVGADDAPQPVEEPVTP